MMEPTRLVSSYVSRCFWRLYVIVGQNWLTSQQIVLIGYVKLSLETKGHACHCAEACWTRGGLWLCGGETRDVSCFAWHQEL